MLGAAKSCSGLLASESTRNCSSRALDLMPQVLGDPACWMRGLGGLGCWATVSSKIVGLLDKVLIALLQHLLKGPCEYLIAQWLECVESGLEVDRLADLGVKGVDIQHK